MKGGQIHEKEFKEIIITRTCIRTCIFTLSISFRN